MCLLLLLLVVVVVVVAVIMEVGMGVVRTCEITRRLNGDHGIFQGIASARVRNST